MTARFTVTETAQRLGYDPAHVRLLIRTGKLPATREDTPRGVVYWINAADVAAFTPAPRGRPRKEENA